MNIPFAISMLCCGGAAVPATAAPAAARVGETTATAANRTNGGIAGNVMKKSIMRLKIVCVVFSFFFSRRKVIKSQKIEIPHQHFMASVAQLVSASDC